VAHDGLRRPPVVGALRLRGVALIGDVGRCLTFVGLTTVIGAVAFYYGTLGRAAVGDTSALAGRAARLGAWAALVILIGSWLRVWAQYTSLVDPTMTAAESRGFFGAMVLHTQWGRMWIASVGLGLLAWVAFARRSWPTSLVIALALGVTPALAGHAMSDSSYPAVSIMADAIHVVAASAWLGTLFVIALTAILPRDSTPQTLLALVTAFSPIALASATTLAITGLYAAVIHLGSWSAVFASAYGRTLCVKLVLVAGVAAVGFYNWRYATPRCAAGDESAFRHSARAELVLGASVLLVTAILVATDLPMSMAT
jgi:copper resistance protein D